MAAFIGFKTLAYKLRSKPLDSTGMPRDSAMPAVAVSYQLSARHSLMGPADSSLEAELVRHFHEKLPAVVDIALRRVQSSQTGWIRDQRVVQVLQVAVIAYIDRRARMHQVGEQEIGVELLLRRQVGVQVRRCAGSAGQVKLLARGVRKYGVVLQDHAQRKLRRKLPVPFAAHDVVVEDAFPDRN